MSEDGSSPVTAVFGFVVLLSFLLGAVQLSLHLFASSAVSSAAFDAARAMAAENGISCSQAEARVRQQLGSYGDRVTARCPPETPADLAAMRVVAPSPAPFLDGFFGLQFDLGTIEREAFVLREEFRSGADL
jgi:hypothetical protein